MNLLATQPPQEICRIGPFILSVNSKEKSGFICCILTLLCFIFALVYTIGGFSNISNHHLSLSALQQISSAPNISSPTHFPTTYAPTYVSVLPTTKPTFSPNVPWYSQNITLTPEEVRSSYLKSTSC